MPRNIEQPSLRPDKLEYFRQVGAKGGAIRKALPPKERSAITQKGWETRRRNGTPDNTLPTLNFEQRSQNSRKAWKTRRLNQRRRQAAA